MVLSSALAGWLACSAVRAMGVVMDMWVGGE